jgi:hypothetical protein
MRFQLIPRLMLLLATASQVSAYAVPPPPLDPPVKIADHIDTTQVLSSELALVRHEDGNYSTISLTPPYAQQPWNLAWPAGAEGWKLEPHEFGPNFAASHDGGTIAFGFNVITPSADPTDEYPLLVTAIVLCDADGFYGRCVALTDIVDGGPRLYFTQNDHFLLGPDYLPCAPTPDGLRGWYAAMNDNPADPLPDPPSALDLRTAKLVSFEALRDVPWLTMNPYSDEFYFDEMDTNKVHFGCFSNDKPLLLSEWAPPDGTAFSNMYWAGTGTIMIWMNGTAELQYPLAYHAESQWVMNVFYAQLGYASPFHFPMFFSSDGGHSIRYGMPWPDGSQEVPSLSHFAVPVDSDGWPERVDTWLPLPDHSGVLINTPGVDGGVLYLVKLDSPASPLGGSSQS